jgi:hypothetical protein
MGQFRLSVTADGGSTWQPLSPRTMPPALPGEGAFAASGTCLVAQGKEEVWFVTGGAKAARVFHSRNRGQDWSVRETPSVDGVESAGIFSMAFDEIHSGRERPGNCCSGLLTWAKRRWMKNRETPSCAPWSFVEFAGWAVGVVWF